MKCGFERGENRNYFRPIFTLSSRFFYTHLHIVVSFVAQRKSNQFRSDKVVRIFKVGEKVT